MKLKTLLKFGATLAACLPFLSLPSLNADPSKPMNVVLIVADDWRFDTLSAMGHPIVKTPSLDKLASEGVLFEHGYVTTSICGVSRASILTGQWMSRHKNFGFEMFETDWEDTFYGIMADRGYYTGYVGKWHCGQFPANKFDYSNVPAKRHWVGDGKGGEIHITERNLRNTKTFFEKKPADKPFLLSVNFLAPHSWDNNPKQYLPQPRSMSLYADDTIPRTELHSEAAFKKLPEFLQNDKTVARYRYRLRFDTPEKYQEMMKNYYRLCTEVDEACGAIVEYLRATGELENTLIIFIGDNGYFHAERGLAGKWYPYQNSIRVPLIIRDPRLPDSSRGMRNEDIVLNVDVAPTILSAVDLPVPSVVQGKDLAPLYLNPEGDHNWRTEFFYEHETRKGMSFIPGAQSVVSKYFKYNLWPEADDYEQLFDLREDPMELNNLAKDRQHEAALAKTRELLEQLREAAQ